MNPHKPSTPWFNITNIAIGILLMLAYLCIQFKHPVLHVVFYQIFKFATDEARYGRAEQWTAGAGYAFAAMAFTLVFLKYVLKTHIRHPADTAPSTKTSHTDHQTSDQ